MSTLKLASALPFVFFLLFPALALGQSPRTNAVELSFQRLSESQSGSVVTLQLGLAVKSIGPGVVQNIRVAAVDPDGAWLNPSNFFFGNLGSEETASASLVLSFDHSQQEPPRILWQVEYTDSEGVFRTERLYIR